MTQEIEIKVADGVQVIRFARGEEERLHGAMYNAMSEALDGAGDERRYRGPCLHRLGGVFSPATTSTITRAGWRQGAMEKASRRRRWSSSAACPRWESPRSPRSHGLAIGIGTTMLLHCDLVYATPAASLRTPFLDLGLVQEAGSSILAPERMGYPRAFELICLGEPFSAERAFQAGLVNAVVPADKLEETAMKAARRLAAKPRHALMMARRLLRRDPGRIGAMIEEEAQAYTTLMRSPEAREAFTAFLEKRPPDFAKARRGG
jgi:enoyl-CoA hydratase/carnithine racemase